MKLQSQYFFEVGDKVIILTGYFFGRRGTVKRVDRKGAALSIAGLEWAEDSWFAYEGIQRVGLLAPDCSA